MFLIFFPKCSQFENFELGATSLEKNEKSETEKFRCDFVISSWGVGVSAGLSGIYLNFVQWFSLIFNRCLKKNCENSLFFNLLLKENIENPRGLIDFKSLLQATRWKSVFFHGSLVNFALAALASFRNHAMFWVRSIETQCHLLTSCPVV